MSKYGLNLRPQQKKPTPKPPIPKVLGFGNDEDDDVEREISRHASKTKSLRETEEQQKKALEEDPSAFDYDGVYDEMKSKTVQPKAIDREERKPKYIQNLLRKAEQRQKEQEIIYERKLAKERSEEDHLYSDKDKYVTSAYKKKLAEQAKWMEEERRRQIVEEKDDVTKKTDLSDFYFNLGKNVAFGAKDAETRKLENSSALRKPGKPEERAGGAEISDNKHPSEESNSPKQAPFHAKEEHLSESSHRRSTSPEPAADVKPVSDLTDSAVPGPNPAINRTKRSEDSLAAAKERFLARKRAKEQ